MSNKILNSVQFPGLEDTYINPCNVRENLLKNWYFVGGGTGENSFPINSRKFEMSANTNHVWSIDNWYINDGYGTQQLSPYGMVFTNADNTTGNTTFQQYLDYFQDDLAGKTITVSALIDDDLYTESAVIPERTGSDQIPINFNCGESNNGRISIYVLGSNHYSPEYQYYTQYLFQFLWGPKQSSSSETYSAQVRAFKVEIGEGQTLCHKEGLHWVFDDIPNYQKELLRCWTSNSNDQDSYSNQQFGFNVSNPNLLDNWYFVGRGTGNNIFPINQRSSFSYTNAVQYTIDRWKTSNTGTSVLLYDDALRLRSDSGSMYGYLLQYIDQQEQLLNKLVTLSILTTKELYTSTVKLPSVLPSANTIYANIPNIGHILCLNGKWVVRLCADYNSYENYVAVKLELGIHQTLAHKEDGVWVVNEIPNYQDQLLKCQKYLQKICIDYGSPLIGSGVVRSSTQASLMIPLLCSMSKDVTPTIIYTDLSSIKLWHGQVYGASSAPAITSIVYPSLSGAILSITVTCSGLTAGEVCLLQLTNDASFYVSTER